MFFLLSGLLYAQEIAQKTDAPTSISHHVNLRMGYSSATSNGRPTLCLEGVIQSVFAIETCGTGYGFVHQASGTDFVHFRGKWSILSKEFNHAKLQGQLGAGFAEIQIAADALGFQFGGTGAGVETAGPEVSASVQWLRSFGPQAELIVDMNAGAAFFYYGPELIQPQNQLFPFLELSIGLGW